MSTLISGVKNSVLKAGIHRMTLDFGNTYSDGSFHKGVDLIADNTNGGDGYDYVVAIADGKVTACANNITGVVKSTGTQGMGNYVYIEHSDGYRTRYQHMKCGSVTVKVGDTVKKGQVIGYMGNTGNSSGRHLHFDVSKSGQVSGGTYVSSQKRTYFDPKPFLKGTKSIGGTSVTTTTTTAKATSTSTGTKYVTTANVNVRKGAGTSYSKVSFTSFSSTDQAAAKKIAGKAVNYFPKGMTFTVTATSGNWLKCASGWVSASYCKKSS